MSEEQASLPKSPAPNAPSQPARLWPLWTLAALALILALGVAGGGWFLWQGQQALQTQNQQLDQHLSNLEQQTSQQNNSLDQRLQQVQKSVDQQGKTLARHSREIDHNAQALLNAGHRSHTDWLLAEAEYLLRIANQRLQLEQDFHGALKLLQKADKVLSQSNDPGVFPVRRALAHEEMALENVQSVDRTGLYLKLEAALDNVHNLDQSALMKIGGGSRQSTGTSKNSASKSGSPEQHQKSAQQSGPWQEILSSLKRVIVIRRLDQPVKPLPGPEQSAYLQLDLRLRLQQAETALLRGDAKVYHSALQQALDELNHWFDDSKPRVAALKNSLQSLAGKNINPKLPDISQSLQLLKARIAGRDQQASGGGTSAPKASPSQGGQSQ